MNKLSTSAVAAAALTLTVPSAASARSVTLNYNVTLSADDIRPSGELYHQEKNSSEFEFRPGDTLKARVQFRNGTVSLRENGDKEGFSVLFSAIPPVNGVVWDVDPVYFSFIKPVGLKTENRFYNSAGGSGFSGGPGFIDLTDSELTFSGFELTGTYKAGVATRFKLGGFSSVPGSIAKVNLRQAGAVPEPATWAMMIGGFGLLGAAARRRSRTQVTYA